MNDVHQKVLTRRGFCLCCVASTAFAATGGWLTPAQVFAKARNIVDMMRAGAADARIDVYPVRGGISVLVGSGGNIAVLPGADGKILVDAGITASRPRILSALATLGNQPITTLVNTHWHFDHADGNEWLHGAGAAIFAHQNTGAHLMQAQRVEDWDFDFPPSPPTAIPTETVANTGTLRLNGMTLDLDHHPAAHTDGDLSVNFAEADIIHTGDIFWNGIYPFIDYSTGGSIDGVISGVETILAKVGNDTIIIPGHGHPLARKADLVAYREMLLTVREKVASLKTRGMSLDEIVSARPTADFDAVWGQFVISPAFFTKLIHEGV